ncbi:MAG: DUF4175 family protein [Bacteroidetes bacterium]|nr:DUF4175 family protein [Bacteroidota bacterium]
MTNYDRLISNLDAFIRKYYANQLLRGTLIILICIIAYILLATVGEYYLYLPVWSRIAIVSVFLIAGLAALGWLVILPLSKMARMGKVISHEQAATIIGRHFPEVRDKLLNILQLKNQHDHTASKELIEASIGQKAAQIAVVPFTGAVDLARNRKYLPYLLPLLLVGVFILVAAPNVFKDGSRRLLQPTITFERPAPFRFIVKNNKLQTVRNADFVLQVSVDGNALPAEMYMATGNDKILMQTSGKNEFQYTFRNVTEPVTFRLYASGFYSKEYTLSVAQKPVLKAFRVKINYPEYTGRKDEERSSLGDMTVPAGTYVSWAFAAAYTDEARIRMGDGAAQKLPSQMGMFGAQYRFMNDTSYVLSLKNNGSGIIDSFTYHVKVIQDEYPVLQLQEFKDTVNGKQVLINGTAGDDYGISRVLFHIKQTGADKKIITEKVVPLKTTPGTLTTFQHYFDVSVFNLQPNQQLTYYVEAWDNDGVHGSKATRSAEMSYKMFSTEQIDSAMNANSQQINSGLSNSAEHTQELQSQYKEMQTKMLQSDNLDFEQKQNLQQMANMQQQLQQQMEAVKKRLEDQIEQSKQKEYSEDLKDKQDALQKQMDNLLNKELKEQMKRLQDLMKQLNKDKALQAMKEMEQENKLFNMDLKRMQELMKQMEMQMRLEDLANKMDKLAEKQLDLKSQTDKGKKDKEQLGKEQDALKKELENAMNKEMKEAQDLNKQQESPQNLDDVAKTGDEAKKEMQQSSQQLNEGKAGASSKSQSQAAQNLQSMAQSMRNSAGGMDVPTITKDIRAVRQILTNLVRLSFDEERLMKTVRVTPVASQAYLNNQDEQKRLHANSRMIRDSLFEMSKKIAKLHASINKETTELEKEMSASVTGLENRRIDEVVVRQQGAMMHTNNLALMLNETLANLMQMQAQAMKQGKAGSCNKPGGMTPKPGPGEQLSDIITKQQQLGDAMQQMKNAQQQRNGSEQGDKQGDKQGDQAGKTSNGKQQGSNGEYGDPQQLAMLAQQQAALRRQLQQLNSLLNSKGIGNAKVLKDIQDKMDRTETDLVNRRLSNELLQRQREIMSRLLQAEKSLREQEQDDKRSSKNPEEISRPVPPELQKYINQRQQLLEQYKTVPAQLKPYYRDMVQQYYQKVGK